MTPETDLSDLANLPKVWKSRIIGTGYENPEHLLANPKNARIHPMFQRKALEGHLEDIGWVAPVIVNKRTGFVVDGHLRVDLAMQRGEKAIPVIYVDLSDEEETKVILFLDRITGLAVYDDQKVQDLLTDVKTSQEGLIELMAFISRDHAERLQYLFGGGKEGQEGDGEGGEGQQKQDNFSEWRGMPEFQQEEQGIFKRISVCFDNEADFCAFGDIIGQNLTMETKTIWHPWRDQDQMGRELAFEDES